MKKHILQLSATSDPHLAGQIISTISGAMVTNVQGNQLTVYCSERLNEQQLLQSLHNAGVMVSEL